MTFKRLLSIGQGEGGIKLCYRLRWGNDSSQDAFIAWVKDRFMTAINANSKIISAHALLGVPAVRAEMDQFRETGHQDEWVDATLILEFGSESDIDGDAINMFSITHLQNEGIECLDLEVGIYRKMVSFTAG